MISFVCLTFLMQSKVVFAAFKLAEKEIKASQPIDFVSFEGRSQRVLSSVQQVRGIGNYLASNIDQPSIIYAGKYKVTKLRDAQSEKFSADIMEILRTAKVNTINDLRYILAGYLNAAYAYNSNDAHLLSVFVSYYNALYRAHLDQLKNKYSQHVLKALHPERVGLSQNYQNWAGQSQVIIPLINDAMGGGIDSFEIGNKDVQESLKKEPNKGIQDREAIVKAQEVQLDQEKQALKDNQNKNVAQEQKLEGEHKALEQKLAQAKTPEEKAKIQEELKKNQAEENANKQAEKALAQDKTVIKNQEQQLSENKKSLEQDQKNQPAEEKKPAEATTPPPAQPEQKEASTPTNNEPQNNQPSTPPATDNSTPPPSKQPNATQENLEKKVIEQQKKLERNENIENNLFYYLKKINYYSGANKDSSLVMVDATSQKVMKTSSLKTISGNHLNIFDSGIIVIARENPKTTQNHLTLIDKKTLEIKKVGQENIYSQGMIKVEDQNVYAIFQKGDHYYLGQFDFNLALIHESSLSVDKDTFFSFYQDNIYLSGEDGAIMILTKKDLKATENQITE